MGRNSFVVYKDWRDVLNDFDDKLFRELVNAIFDFGFDQKETARSQLVIVAMKLIKPQILKDWERYNDKCQKLRANGLRGGAPKGNQNAKKKENNQNNQMVNKTTKNNQNNQMGGDNDNVYDNDNVDIINDIYTKEDINISLSDAAIDYREFLQAYNEAAQGKPMAKCIKLTEKRKKAIRARVAEFGKSGVLQAIERASKSAFLNGQNQRNWTADFDFVFNANKMANILEGKYDNINSITHEAGRNNSERRAIELGKTALLDIFSEMEERRRNDELSGE